MVPPRSREIGGEILEVAPVGRERVARRRRARPPACRGTARSAFRRHARSRAGLSRRRRRSRRVRLESASSRRDRDGHLARLGLRRNCASANIAAIGESAQQAQRPRGDGTGSASSATRQLAALRETPAAAWDGRPAPPGRCCGRRQHRSDEPRHHVGPTGKGPTDRVYRTLRRGSAPVKRAAALRHAKGEIAAPSEPRCVAALGRRSIVLVGMMGAGKSSIGRRLAHGSALPFVDADAEIEKAAGMTIPDIFADHGEAYFRSGEARVIARLLDERPAGAGDRRRRVHERRHARGDQRARAFRSG